MSNLPFIVKLVIFTVKDGQLLVYQKANNLPSNTPSLKKKLDDEAEAILNRQTGLKQKDFYAEQLFTITQNNRLIVVYFFLIPANEIPEPEQKYFIKSENGGLGDKDIINYAVQRVRWKIEYTNVVYSLLPKEFTLTDLQEVYEAILGKKLDKRNFRKKILSLKIIKPSGHIRKLGKARPAEMFKFKTRELEFVRVL